MTNDNMINLDDIKQARTRIRPYANLTPVITSKTLDNFTGANIFLKCENFQKTGAFKFRGACNAVMALTEEDAAKGVIAVSSGNHAQAMALSAKIRGLNVIIVMPENSAQVKVDAVREYGAKIELCNPDPVQRQLTVERRQKETGMTLIHPFNNPLVIAGQGTAAMELLEEVTDLDVVMAPVGGGGLLSGTCLAVKAVSPNTDIIAGEPENADDAFRSFQAGKIIPVENPNTIADGLRTSLGTLTFPIIKQNVKSIITVSENEIAKAMRLIWERMKIIIEPSAAVPIAVLYKQPELFKGKKIGIIISGGNVDLQKLPWL